MKPIHKLAGIAFSALLLASVGASAIAKEPAPPRPPERSGTLETYILLDRTGSMEPIWAEALSSVNAYAQRLATLEGRSRVDADITLAAFDSQDGFQFNVLRHSVDADAWRRVTDREVTPRGMTPLYDAIGRIVSMAEADRPAKAVIVIMTDGEENSSTELDRRAARAALDRARARGWEVVFLGAEFGNFTDAEGVGQSASRNMAVTGDRLTESMNRLAGKSMDYATGAAPSVEWNAEDRAAARESEVQQRSQAPQR
jgi:hypothetical protein